MTQNNRSSKLIHIVGGGFNQVPLVKKAKELGCQILVSDMNVDPPAKEFANYYEQINTTDKESTLRCSTQYNVDLITTDQTDVAVPTVAYVAEKLGLPGIGYDIALRFTNKHIMRSILKERLEEHIPEYHYFNHRNPALEFCRKLHRRSDYLVKPINSQGSKGVRILDDTYVESIEAAFDASMEKGILIEKFVSGCEFSVESFVQKGDVFSLNLTQKYHYSHNPCLDERNTFLGDVEPILRKAIFDVNTKVVKALELPFGNTHAEYKVENGKIYLIEVAARGAGGSISSKVIPYLTGFDPLEALLKTLMGQTFEVRITNYENRHAILKFFNFAPGRIKKIHINKNPIEEDVIVFVLHVRDGDHIRPIEDSRDRPGYFIVCGTERDDILKREKIVESAVRVEYY